MNYSLTKKQAKELVESKLSHFIGVNPTEATIEQFYKAIALIVRDMMSQGRADFSAQGSKKGTKRVYYLCMEFLMGRSLKNNLYNLNLTKVFESVLKDQVKTYSYSGSVSENISPLKFEEWYNGKAPYEVSNMFDGKLDTAYRSSNNVKAGDEIVVDLGKVENLNNEYVSNINFEVRAGEVVGIAGLMGAGRTELAKTIYGHLKKQSGKIILNGKELNHKSAQEGLLHRIAYVSEDRKGDGLLVDLSVRENMTLSSLNRISKGLIIDKKHENERVDSYIERINIKTPSKEQLIRNLSGGNQQKVAIAKAMMIHPEVLILDEPTRGVDVGAKKEIYDLINEFKSQGKAVIMISSEMPEILGLSDRILVLSQGRVTGEFDIKDASQEAILKCAVETKEAI